MIKPSTSQNPWGEVIKMRCRVYEVIPHVQNPNQPSREPSPSLKMHHGDRVNGRNLSNFANVVTSAYHGDESVAQSSLSTEFLRDLEY